MSIAPLKWTYKYELMFENELGIKIAYCTIYAIHHKHATEFTLVNVEEYFAKQVVRKLNHAMKIQRHEFLWGLANMDSQGTLYGVDVK